jgi:4-amino-4-deoxy-L-arabinose transferase-like glycosyltransferase
MALAGALLVKLVRDVTESALAALLALAFYATSFDVIVWMRYVLTDCLFTALATAAFYFLIRGVVLPRSSSRRYLGLCISLLLSFITRATGAILIPVAAFAAWWARRDEPSTFAARVGPWLLLFLLAFSGLVARAYVFADLNRWPTDFLRPVLQIYAVREKTGQVVWDRDSTNRTPPVTTADHVVLEADRFVRFFQFTTPAFSRTHNLINVVYYAPLYLLALVGLADGITGANRPRGRVVAITALWIVSIAWLHAMTLLDFDWRYRLPAMPMLILLCACGAEAIARRWRQRADVTSREFPALDA